MDEQKIIETLMIFMGATTSQKDGWTQGKCFYLGRSGNTWGCANQEGERRVWESLLQTSQSFITDWNWTHAALQKWTAENPDSQETKSIFFRFCQSKTPKEAAEMLASVITQ